MLKQAAEFAVRIEGKDLVAALTNSGAGHNFPTEERHRAVDIVYRFVDGSGLAGEWQLGWRFRQPYRDEPGENTQLLAGATKELRIPIPDGAASAELRVWYRLKPFAKDDDPASTLLEERKVTIP